jgi:hypothetical protein
VQPDGRGIGYTSEALFAADIPLPEVAGIAGEVKFVQTDDRQLVRLGYRVKVPVPALDAAKIPAKYKQRKKLTGGWETLRPKQVVYETIFSFRIKDVDGFLLREVTSEPHFLTSGNENGFQGLVAGPIPVGTARRAATVEAYMSVEKCVTCQHGD